MKKQNTFTLDAIGSEQTWRDEIGFDLEVAEEEVSDMWDRTDTAYSVGGMVWDEEPGQDIARFRKNVGEIEGSSSLSF